MASVIEKTIRKAVTPPSRLWQVSTAPACRAKMPIPFSTACTSCCAQSIRSPNSPSRARSRLNSMVASVRTGPNPHGSAGRGHHWFIGDGMVLGVRLRERPGRVVPQPVHPFAQSWKARAARRRLRGPRRGARGHGEHQRRRYRRQDHGRGVEASKLSPVELDGGSGQRRLFRLRRRADRFLFTAHPHHCPRHGRIPRDLLRWHVRQDTHHVTSRWTRSGEVLRETAIAVRSAALDPRLRAHRTSSSFSICR